MKLGSRLVIVISLLVLGHPGRVIAVPSAMTHEMSGTVQRIDHKTITILTREASKPVVFAWNSKDTQFFQSGKPSTIDSLPIGSRVQIRCSHPIVGSMPLLYRVSWHSSSSGQRSKSY
jgi:hypothetical protein